MLVRSYCRAIIQQRKMLNFNSLFSPPRARLTPSLSQQLNDPNACLLSLLDDDNFISEFRCSSAQVRQFMTYKRMGELVELVTVVGDPSDKKRSYKLPLTAAELLSADIAFVIDKLMPEEGMVVEEEKVVSIEERQVPRNSQEQDDELELSSSESSRQERTDDKQGKSQLPTCGQQQQEFGEFVSAPVRAKKTVIVKQVVQTVTMVKREHPGLIIKLFEYFNNHINYTLTAYCCRVLLSLLNKRTNKFLTTLFQYQIYSASMLNHIESRSTVQLLTKIFTAETQCCIEDRVTFFNRIVEASQVPQELNVMSNISATICETIEKVSANMKSSNPCQEVQVYLNSIPQMLEKIVGNILNEHQTVSVYSVGVLYVLINSFPAHLDNDSIDITLFRFLQGAIIKLQQALATKRSPLGVGRVRLVQVMNFILKRAKIKEYLSQKPQFLSLLIRIIKHYSLNNILHNEVFKLITNGMTSQSVLTQSMLKDQILINWLYEQAKEQGEAMMTHNLAKSKAYKGYLTTFCKKLKQISINNPLFSQLVSGPKFSEVYHIFVQQPAILARIDLGGYSTHREDKLRIMTSKQQILKHYATFLANAPPPIFEFDPDFCNPILIQQLQRQLDGVQQQNSDESRPQEVIEEQKHKAELIQENQQHKSAFWKMHLQYNVEDLINEGL